MSDTTQPGASGTTAQAAKARTKLIRGARMKTTLSAPSGMTISFSTNFRKSAKDCSRPNGPTMLGPLRICTPAQILRSASSRKASDSRIQIMTARIWPTASRVQPPGVAQKLVVASMPYSAAIFSAPGTSAWHSAMVTLARAIGLVR